MENHPFGNRKRNSYIFCFVFHLFLLCPSSTLVEQLNHILKVKGSYPATVTGHAKTAYTVVSQQASWNCFYVLYFI